MSGAIVDSALAVVESTVSETAGTPAVGSFARALFKPGQIKPRPSPGSGERVFYSSLWDEKVWIMIHVGLRDRVFGVARVL